MEGRKLYYRIFFTIKRTFLSQSTDSKYEVKLRKVKINALFQR